MVGEWGSEAPKADPPQGRRRGPGEAGGPHVSASKTPTANAEVRWECRLQVALTPSVAPSRCRAAGTAKQTRGPWVLAPAGQEARAQRWQSGSPQRGTPDTLAWRLGVWSRRAGSVPLIRHEGRSRGHGLHETGQVSWLRPRVRCPRAGGNPRQSNRTCAWGFARASYDQLPAFRLCVCERVEK
jgi:hypothetical protein